MTGDLAATIGNGMIVAWSIVIIVSIVAYWISSIIPTSKKGK